MTATVQPNGKGLYVRGEPRDELELADVTGCQWIALNVRDPRHTAALRNRQTGALGLWLYTLIDGWQPDTWKGTLARMETIAGEFPTVRGFVADIESAPEWMAHRTEHTRLVTALAAASRPVLVTSFPSHPLIREWAEAGLGGSPQMYLLGEGGSSSPGTEREGKALVSSWWNRWIGAGFKVLVPSLSIGTRATAGPRTEAQQREYLRSTPIAPAAIAWSQSLAMPAASSPLARAWADYNPRAH